MEKPSSSKPESAISLVKPSILAKSLKQNGFPETVDSKGSPESPPKRSVGFEDVGFPSSKEFSTPAPPSRAADSVLSCVEGALDSSSEDELVCGRRIVRTPGTAHNPIVLGSSSDEESDEVPVKRRISRTPWTKTKPRRFRLSSSSSDGESPKKDDEEFSEDIAALRKAIATMKIEKDDESDEESSSSWLVADSDESDGERSETSFEPDKEEEEEEEEEDEDEEEDIRYVFWEVGLGLWEKATKKYMYIFWEVGLGL